MDPRTAQRATTVTQLPAPLPLGVTGHVGPTVIVGLNGLCLLADGTWGRARDGLNKRSRRAMTWSFEARGGGCCTGAEHSNHRNRGWMPAAVDDRKTNGVNHNGHPADSSGRRCPARRVPDRMGNRREHRGVSEPATGRRDASAAGQARSEPEIPLASQAKIFGRRFRSRSRMQRPTALRRLPF